MDEAQLMELSETEGVQQIIELTSDGKLEQIIHFDRTKFGKSLFDYITITLIICFASSTSHISAW